MLALHGPSLAGTALTAFALACVVGGCRDAVELGSVCEDGRCACVEAEQDLGALPDSCASEPETCGRSALSPDADVCQACMTDNRDRYYLDETPLLRCACRHCAVQLAACRDSGDRERDQLCQAVVNCALRRNCAGSECYCGEGVSEQECRRDDAPSGPCAPLISSLFEQDAACDPDVPRAACILDYQEHGGDNALHRAYKLSLCMGNPVYRRSGHCLPEIAVQVDAGTGPTEMR